MGLKKVAKEATKGLSDLFDGREKLEENDRAIFLDKPLSLADFDMLDYDSNDEHLHYAVCVFSESEEYAYCAGFKLTQMLDNYINEEHHGDVKRARAAYKKEVDRGEALVVVLTETKTKKGRTFISVEVAE